MANVQSNTTVTFPRSKKRGAKVRTGPCAQVIPMPGLYLGDELDERYEWIKSHDRDWATTENDGTKPVNWSLRSVADGIRMAEGKGPLTDRDKRVRIAHGRARIETRNRVKAYLEQRGVGLDKIRNAEEALFALFGFVEATP